MTEKTYVAVVAHEGVKLKQKITTEPTPRMEALLGAGYYAAEIQAVAAEPAADWVDDAEDSELLERFEELDVVEVVVEKPKTKRIPRSPRG